MKIKGQPTVVAICINFNQAQYTIDCVSSILQSNYKNLHIILIDNGSKKEVVDKMLKGLKKSPLLSIECLENNLGYVQGINYGMRLGERYNPDYYLILNNDTFIDSESVFNLVNTAEIDNYEFCPLVYQDTDQLLTLTIEHIVAVTGSVRQPGIFPVTDNTSVSFLLAVAGGPSNDADMANIETINYNRQLNNLGGVLVVNSFDTKEVDVKLNVMNAGGSIHLRSKYVNIEPKGVVVSGEVANPGTYTIRKGEKLSSLFSRAGGLTKQAYPYGAILTRESVKVNQRNEMGKTAQRLKSAVMSSSVKTDVGGDSLVALMAMIDQMAAQDFAGRIVIEADPVVISLDPSKDVVLEGGDNLYIPPRLNFVMTVGDVLSPSALSFVSGKDVNEYLKDSGGFNISADKDRAFAILPNGVAKPLNLGSWGRKNSINLPPGSSIVVPTNLSPYDGITLTRELGIIFQSLAVSAASIAVLTR